MQNRTCNKDNIIRKKTFQFSLTALELYKIMSDQHEYVISKQLLKSATSIGANVEEAIAAHSKKDFLAKNIIALKEARETHYWLKLILKSPSLNFQVENLLKDIDEIIAILSSIVKTTKERL